MINNTNFTDEYDESGDFESGDYEIPFFHEEIELYQHALDTRDYLYSKIFPAIFGIGSIWNILIIVYFVKINVKNLKKMSAYHFLIISLAVIDLCASAGLSITQPLSRPWKLGVFGCVFFKSFMEFVCSMISAWLLVLISFARFRSIVHPLCARINKKKYGFICILICTASCLSNSYMYLNHELERSEGILMCGYMGKVELLLLQIGINYVLDSFIPCGIMLCLYYKMKTKMHAEENANSFVLNNQSRQRNRTALRTIRGLIILFTLTVIPVRVLQTFSWTLIYYANETKPPFFLMSLVFIRITDPLTVFVVFMNNILNIFIYAKMIPAFRRFLLTIFTFGIYGRRNAIN